MEKSSAKAILRDSPLFEGISEVDVDKFIDCGVIRAFSAGDEIIKEEDISKVMYILLKGKVEVFKKLPNGNELYLSKILPSRYVFTAQKGDFFGEMALFEDETVKRSSYVKAITDIIVFEISKKNFFSFISENHKAGITLLQNILKIVVHRLRDMNEELFNYANLLTILKTEIQKNSEKYLTAEGKAFLKSIFG